MLVPVGHYWTVKNLPVFTHGGTDPVLEDKSIYQTLVRLGPTYNKYGPAFVEIFKHFKWTRVALLAKDYHICDFGASSVNHHFPLHNLTVAEWIRVSKRGITDAQVEEYLDRIQERSRSKH